VPAYLREWLARPETLPVAGAGLLLGTLLWTRLRYGRQLRTEARARAEADAARDRVQRARRLLSESSQAVIRASDEQLLLETVCRIVIETGGYRLAWVGYAQEGPERRIHPVARAGYDEGYVTAVDSSWGDGLRAHGPDGAAVRLGRPSVVQDIFADSAFEPWRAEAAARGYGSAVALPLRAGGRTFGALVIFASERAAFDPDTLEPLADLANNLSHGIGALRLRAEQRRAEQRLWVATLKQAMLNRLLHLAFEPLTLAQQLQRALRELLAVPWLPLGRVGMVCLAPARPGGCPTVVAHSACPQLEAAVIDLTRTGMQAADLGLGGQGARLACAACGDQGQAYLPFCWVPVRSGRRLLGVLALGLASEPAAPPDLGPEQDFLLALANTLAAIIERKKAEEQLGLFVTVFESAAEGIMVTDADNRIVAVNDAFCAITGYDSAAVLGCTPRFLRSDRHDDAFYAGIWEAINRDGRWQGEIWNRRQSGEVYPEWLSISVIRDPQGALAYHVGVFTDIGTLKRSQARLDYLAHHDALTGLPNRLLFSARLEHALQRAARDRQGVALMFLDLDGFKAVNDSLGHLAGDQLLQGVAERLRASVREQDTVARLAGDEFVMIVEALADPGDAAVVARKALDALAAPFRLAGQDVTVTASIGVSLYPSDGRDLATLLRCADHAMYRAKQRRGHGGAFEFFRTRPETGEAAGTPPVRLRGH
jgi:diguanylate cyclase (GGDEF)-like protein/PAS domain S-box-containing protein